MRPEAISGRSVWAFRPAVAALCCAVGLTVAPAPAQAAGEQAGLRITLTSLAPAVAAAGDDVVITGRVTNTGSTTIEAPDVTLHGSWIAVAGRDAVAGWAAADGPGASGTPPGELLDHDDAPGQLAPGASSSFRLLMADPAGTAAAPFGALPVTVSAGGTRRSTFVTYQRRREYEPLQTTVIVPLTLAPAAALLAGYGRDRGAAWQAELGTGGRLPAVIDATAGLPVTWALDPMLVDAPDEIPVERPLDDVSGAAWDRIGPDQKAETTLRRGFAAGLRARLGGRTTIILPNADPDLSTLLGAGLARLFPGLHATAARLSLELPGRNRADIAWPADGRIGEEQLAAIAPLYGAAGPSSVLGSTDSMTGENTPVAAQRSREGATALAYDAGMSAALADLDADPAGIATRQQLLADSVALLAEFPSTRRTLLLAAPRDLAPATGEGLRTALAGLLDAPWIATSSLETLQTEAALGPLVPEVAAAPADSSDPPEPTGPPLTKARIGAAGTAIRSITALAQIRDDREQYLGLWAQSYRQLFSSRWRSDREALGDAVGTMRDAGRQARQAVAVVPQTINFFADSGLLTLTLTNDLPVAVRDVRVELLPLGNRLRLEQTPEPVDIGPGSRASLRIRATALAAGSVPIRVSLQTPDDRRIGSEATVLVRAYPTGSGIYWGIGGAAGLLLVIGLVRGRRRRRARE